MKKLAAVVSVALAVAMAAPVVAAGPSLSGSLEGKLSWQQGAEPTSGVNLKLNLGFQAGDKAKAVLGLAPSIDGNAWAAGIERIDVTKAYVETQGPWWKGGPAVTTRIGDLDIDYSPYVAKISSTEGQTRGLSVSGLQVGPFALAGFHAWDSNAAASQSKLQNHQATGIRVAGQIAGINLAATGVMEGERLSGALEGSTQVLPNVAIGGALARDEANQATMYRIGAQVVPVSNLAVIAEYGRVPSQFAPLYVDGDPNGFVAQTRGQAVVNLGAATEQAGFRLGAGLKMARAENADQFRRTETTFTAARTVALQGIPVETSYRLTIDGQNKMTHEIAGKATLNLIPALQGLTVDGKVKMADSKMAYGVNAGYTAPNGMQFGLHYDNGDIDGNGTAGLSADAGLTVSF